MTDKPGAVQPRFDPSKYFPTSDYVQHPSVNCYSADDASDGITCCKATIGLIQRVLRISGGTAVLSTPAPEMRAGRDHLGPPHNPSHVREWTREEFQAFLRDAGVIIDHASLTRSDDAPGGLTTQLTTTVSARGSDTPEIYA